MTISLQKLIICRDAAKKHLDYESRRMIDTVGGGCEDYFEANEAHAILQSCVKILAETVGCEVAA